MELKRVVVTGLGAVTPLGNNVNDYWNGLINGVSGCDLITRFNTENFKTKFACEVKNFKPEDYFDRKEVRKYDLFTIFALVAADEAVKDSGLDLDVVNKDRVGVIFGSGIGGFGTFLSEVGDYFKGNCHPPFQSVLYSQNHFRHCSRTHIHQVWVPRTEFCHRFRMCHCYQCHHRCI